MVNSNVNYVINNNTNDFLTIKDVLGASGAFRIKALNAPSLTSEV